MSEIWSWFADLWGQLWRRNARSSGETGLREIVIDNGYQMTYDMSGSWIVELFEKPRVHIWRKKGDKGIKIFNNYV